VAGLASKAIEAGWCLRTGGREIKINLEANADRWPLGLYLAGDRHR
jgi:hypothetical protein